MIVVVFAIMGAVLQGQHVMKTIGSGIVQENLDYIAVLIALISSGFFVTLATFFKIPTSTSQAIVGGVAGIGLAVGAPINVNKLFIIATSWVLCPVSVMILAFYLSHFLRFFLKRFGTGTIFSQHILGWLAILSSCYVAYSMGANNAGNAMGPISNLGIIHPRILLFIGGVSIAVGAATYGRRVSDTVGKGITPLDIPGAFVAQISSAFGMHLFSILGIPVSTSAAIVGAVVGVGLVRGVKAISKNTITTILAGWILTPTLAGVTAFVLYKTIKILF
jgi:phosphate/sulfate permease